MAVPQHDPWDRVTIGRGMGADIPLTWDPDVSRVHAELSRLADDWTVIDAVSGRRPDPYRSRAPLSAIRPATCRASRN
jgi:hypothetical protein